MENHELSTIILISALSVAFGAAVIFRGWQMHFRHRHDLLTDWDDQPIPDPGAHSRAFFLAYALGGLTLCLLPLLLLSPLHVIFVLASGAVPLFGITRAVERIARRAHRSKAGVSKTSP